MVSAILAGTKTQTRRLVKPQPLPDNESLYLTCHAYSPTKVDRHGEEYPGPEVFGFSSEFRGWVSPYGAPGDRLWVRETWRESGNAQMADGSIPKIKPMSGCAIYAADDSSDGPWRPSIFMPRWASRITLEVKSVRVERVQDITEADAVAEGCEANYSSARIQCITDKGASFSVSPEYIHGVPKVGDEWLGGKVVVAQRIEPQIIATAKRNYITLWNTINGFESWAANPWVWVVEFSRLAGETK